MAKQEEQHHPSLPPTPAENDDDDEFGDFDNATFPAPVTSLESTAISATNQNDSFHSATGGDKGGDNNGGDDQFPLPSFPQPAMPPPPPPCDYDTVGDGTIAVNEAAPPPPELPKAEEDVEDHFGNFGDAAPPFTPTPLVVDAKENGHGNDESSSTGLNAPVKEIAQTGSKENTNDSFGDFGTFQEVQQGNTDIIDTQDDKSTTVNGDGALLSQPENKLQTASTVTPENDFGTFDEPPPPSVPPADDVKKTLAPSAAEDDFGTFDEAPSPPPTDDAALSLPDEKKTEIPLETTTTESAGPDDDFGDFGTFDDAGPPTEAFVANDSAVVGAGDDDFGDFAAFGEAPSPEEPVTDDFGDVGDTATNDDFGDFETTATSPPPEATGSGNKDSNQAVADDDDDDDFGDFGTFDEAPPPPPQAESTPDDFGDFDNAATTTSNDDDFGDFEATTTSAPPQAESADDGTNDDFGNFETTPAPPDQTNDDDNDDDDDFGDFDNAPAGTRAPATATPSSPTPQTDDPLVKDATELFQRLFRPFPSPNKDDANQCTNEVVVTLCRSVFPPHDSSEITTPTKRKNNLIRRALLQTFASDLIFLGNEPPSAMHIEDTDKNSSTADYWDGDAAARITLGPRDNGNITATSSSLPPSRVASQESLKDINGEPQADDGEMSEEAKQFLERIPDLSFMLEDSLCLKE